MPALALVLAVAFAAPSNPVAVAEGIELLPGAFVPGRQPDGNTVMIRAPAGWIERNRNKDFASNGALVTLDVIRQRPRMRSARHIQRLDRAWTGAMGKRGCVSDVLAHSHRDLL